MLLYLKESEKVAFLKVALNMKVRNTKMYTRSTRFRLGAREVKGARSSHARRARVPFTVSGSLCGDGWRITARVRDNKVLCRPNLSFSPVPLPSSEPN